MSPDRDRLEADGVVTDDMTDDEVQQWADRFYQEAA